MTKYDLALELTKLIAPHIIIEGSSAPKAVEDVMECYMECLQVINLKNVLDD